MGFMRETQSIGNGSDFASLSGATGFASAELINRSAMLDDFYPASALAEPVAPENLR
jgi:hypothetical protein